MPQAKLTSPRRSEALQKRLRLAALPAKCPATVSHDSLRSSDWLLYMRVYIGTRMRTHAPAQSGIANCQGLYMRHRRNRRPLNEESRRLVPVGIKPAFTKWKARC